MRLIPVFVFAAMACSGSVTWARAACEAATHLAYDKPVEIEGTLKSGTGQHDAQGEFSYSYVELDPPVCVDAQPNDEFNVGTEAPISRIQLAGEEAAKDLPIGKRVTVAGTLFGQHTMWHVEPVLIDAQSVDAK
jgi:hypothetical protein